MTPVQVLGTLTTMGETHSGSDSAAFRVLTSQCLGQVLDLDLFRYCACGCLTCPHAGRRGAPKRQASFEGYGRTRRAFTGPDALGLNVDLPDQVTAWLDTVPRGERPEFVTAGIGAEPLPGFEESTSVLLESLSRLLEGGVGISLRTRRNVPDPLIQLLSAHASRVRVTVPLPLLKAPALRTWEPGTGSPTQRLFTVQKLRAARIPVAISLKPLIPYVNDDHARLERLVGAVADTGVKQVSAAFLRLRPVIKARLDDGSPVSTRLMYGAYVDRQPEGDRPRQLPDPEIRRSAYRTLAKAARARGLTFKLCRDADPDFGRDPCLLWPDDLPPGLPRVSTADVASPQSRKRRPGKGQVGLDDLFDE